MVRDELLPVITGKFEHIRTGQEDWGWYIWFRRGRIRLEINIYCDDTEAGIFRIWLESYRRKFFRRSTLDTPELEEVRQLKHSRLASWAGNISIGAVETLFH